jgi:hypothetical protein
MDQEFTRKILFQDQRTKTKEKKYDCMVAWMHEKMLNEKIE